MSDHMTIIFLQKKAIRAGTQYRIVKKLWQKPTIEKHWQKKALENKDSTLIPLNLCVI